MSNQVGCVAETFYGFEQSVSPDSSEYHVPPPDRDTWVTASSALWCVRHCAAVGVCEASVANQVYCLVWMIHAYSRRHFCVLYIGTVNTFLFSRLDINSRKEQSSFAHVRFSLCKGHGVHIKFTVPQSGTASLFITFHMTPKHQRTKFRRKELCKGHVEGRW